MRSKLGKHIEDLTMNHQHPQCHILVTVVTLLKTYFIQHIINDSTSFGKTYALRS